MDMQQPQYTPLPPVQNPSKTLGIVSLVTGILALLTSCGGFAPGLNLVCCCSTPLLGIAAIVCGILGLKTPAKTLAMVGLILGVLSLLAVVIVSIIYGLTSAGGSLTNPDMFNNILKNL